jgi:hypothetical protein
VILLALDPFEAFLQSQGFSLGVNTTSSGHFGLSGGIISGI